MIGLTKDSGFVRLAAFFAATTILLVVFRTKLTELNVDGNMVIGGNIIIFLSSILAYSIFDKASGARSGHAVVRNVYTGFVVKFFLLVVAAMLYFFFAKEINNRGVIMCLGLYMVYNFVGARFAAAKQMPHGKKKNA